MFEKMVKIGTVAVCGLLIVLMWKNGSSQMDNSIDNSFYESSIEEEVVIPEEYLSEKVVVSYESTFKDIYGDDVNLDDVTYNPTDDTVTYQGKTFSWDYVEEMAMNHMLNNF